MDALNLSTGNPETTARAAQLHYVKPERLAIQRQRAGQKFRYVDRDGTKVKDEKILGRIRSLAIPPAYEDVRISVDPNAHLQAIGRDARGRRQYRYHPRWRQVRDENKYQHMLVFGQNLPRIRARVEADLAKQGLPREKVLAAVVRLLETTLMRVGNEEYAKANGSFGLTTLRDRHLKVRGARLTFDFRGKSGKQHHIDLEDARLARVVRKLKDLPGQDVFQYRDEGGEIRNVDSSDVNDYLREISGVEITAKDFRTWAATNLAAIAFREIGSSNTKSEAKKNMVQAVEAVAAMLGNTPAICRKCYIHPAIFDGYLDGTLLQGLKRQIKANARDRGLKRDERAVMAFLKRRLEKASRA